MAGLPIVDECVCSHFSAGQVLVLLACHWLWRSLLTGSPWKPGRACPSHGSLPFSRIYRMGGQCGVGGRYTRTNDNGNAGNVGQGG